MHADPHRSLITRPAMPEPTLNPRDLVVEILAETVDRLRRHDEFNAQTLSLLAPMLRDGLGKQGKHLNALLAADEGEA